MAWRLRAGVSLHPMPFGGGFVLDDARLAARQISSELTLLLAGAEAGVAAGSAPGDPPPPVLAAELRLGLHDGWLIHLDDRQQGDKHQEGKRQEDKRQESKQGDEQEEMNA